MPTVGPGDSKNGVSGAGNRKSKSPRCRTCGKAIRVPKGWTAGPAVRRHYWADHRDIMQRGGGR